MVFLAEAHKKIVIASEERMWQSPDSAMILKTAKSKAISSQRRSGRREDQDQKHLPHGEDQYCPQIHADINTWIEAMF